MSFPTLVIIPLFAEQTLEEFHQWLGYYIHRELNFRLKQRDLPVEIGLSQMNRPLGWLIVFDAYILPEGGSWRNRDDLFEFNGVFRLYVKQCAKRRVEIETTCYIIPDLERLVEAWLILVDRIRQAWPGLPHDQSNGVLLESLAPMVPATTKVVNAAIPKDRNEGGRPQVPGLDWASTEIEDKGRNKEDVYYEWRITYMDGAYHTKSLRASFMNGLYYRRTRGNK